MNLRVVAWDAPEADAMRDLRVVVFCDEQKCPRELEIDDVDPTALHILATDEHGDAIATGRLYDDHDRPGAGRIGRMAVRADWRGRGAGSAVLVELMREGLRRGYQRFVLDSQSHAIPFYERYGYKVIGDEHMDCDIPHRMMAVERAEAEEILRTIHHPRV